MSNSLWQTIIDTVEAHRRHGDLQEAVLHAAFLFEKAVMSPEKGATLSLANSQGWPDEVANEPVDRDACARLVASLQQLAVERPNDPSVGSIFWALGKVGDRNLIPFLQQALRQQLHRSDGAVYQIMIALENLGERPFTGRGSRSIDNVMANREFASRYLAKIGVDTADAG